VPVVIITAFGTIESAVESMKLGARDFITKPFSNKELLLVVSRTLENRRLRQEVRQLRVELAHNYGLHNIIAADPKMAAVLEMIERVADTPATVLITGESGTGKDLLARAIHFSNPRHDGPFVPINCAAIPENLIESELFGYSRGAFTDARQAKTGLFITARGGTLFLDEIGEMPMTLQSKLLRAIEDKRIRPLGATEEIAVDVRIVAATNANLEEGIETGRFRPDLYYRLTTVTVAVPPLRERPEDIPLLIKHFLARASAEAGRPVPEIEQQAMTRLLRYSWPGNARELQNAIQRGVILARNNLVTISELPPKVAGFDISPVSMLRGAVDTRMSPTNSSTTIPRDEHSSTRCARPVPIELVESPCLTRRGNQSGVWWLSNCAPSSAKCWGKLPQPLFENRSSEAVPNTDWRAPIAAAWLPARISSISFRRS
jgi:two-component system, NtrC family, response regulator AtoC